MPEHTGEGEIAGVDLERLADLVADRLARRLDARPLYSPKTLAERLDISERVVREMLAGPEPKIRSFLVGDRRRRIDPVEVDRYLATRQDQEPTVE